MFITRVRNRETEVIGTDGELSKAVARSLFKLMAYKDEYEVARLFSGEAFRRQVADALEGSARLSFHLAPPLFARRDRNTGELRKMTFGPWMLTAFRLLASLKRLRGTPFDIFGYTTERVTERKLIAEYRAAVKRVLAALTPDRLELAIKIAEVADDIRGFGHVKQRNLSKVRETWRHLEHEYARPAMPMAAE